MNLAETLGEFFEDEIDAFKGTAEDVVDLVTGKPVHTSPQRWARRAVTIATTVIPIGLGVKAVAKTAKATGAAVKAAAHVSKAKRTEAKAKAAPHISDLKTEAAKQKQLYKQARDVGRVTRAATNLAYYAAGDSAAREVRNQNLKELAQDVTAMTNGTSQNKKKKKRTLSAADRAALRSKGLAAAQGSINSMARQMKSKKYQNEPMTKQDVAILGAQALSGALGALATKKKLRNHPSWYTLNGTNMVGLNFGIVDSYAPRDDLFSHRGFSAKVTTSTDAYINTILTVPTGCSDPLTIAASKLGNEMRLHSGANTIYTPSDIMEYLINARTIMAKIVQMRRALMTLNVVDPSDVDTYMKYTLMCLDVFDSTRAPHYSEFRNNAANILTDLNAVIKATGMMIPINMPIMKRTEWMFTNVFADGMQKKYSTKVFIASALPKATIDENHENITITQVEFLNKKSPLAAMAELRSDVADFVSNRIHMAISGDIMKVYGAQAFWAPALLEGTEILPIVYDEEALTQIQNMTILQTPFLSVGNITQTIVNGVTTTTADTDATRADTTGKLTDMRKFAIADYEKKVVQTYKPAPDGGDILELTRLAFYAQIDVDDSTKKGKATNWICGSEIAYDYGYIRNMERTSDGAYLTPTLLNEMVDGTSRARFAHYWSIDDWAPFIVMYLDPTNAEILPLFDFQNWAAISTPQIASFHYIACFSLYTNVVPILKPTM